MKSLSTPPQLPIVLWIAWSLKRIKAILQKLDYPAGTYHLPGEQPKAYGGHLGGTYFFNRQGAEGKMNLWLTKPLKGRMRRLI